MMSLSFVDKYLPKFYFLVEIFDDESQKFFPVEDFDPWLEMGGHAILISKDDKPLNEKVFRHLHAFIPSADQGKFSFPYDHHLPPLNNGTYKIWGQFKHQGEVMTADFIFNYYEPENHQKTEKIICLN